MLLSLFILHFNQKKTFIVQSSLVLISMMRKSSPQIVVLLVLLIFMIRGTSGATEPKIRCQEAEREALLKIKDGLSVRDSSPENQDIGIFLPSWGEEAAKRECCEWIGIRCDDKTGHVVTLDLSPSSLHTSESTIIEGNNITSPLADLRDLSYLDLSCIELGGISIPSFIGGFGKLRYLNLSSTFLGGEVPPQLGNLSNLQVLDLSHSFDLKITSLWWASRLSSLRILDLSFTNMINARDWLRIVNNLPSLTKLALYSSSLPDVSDLASLSFVNSSKGLAYLDISGNSQLTNSTFKWLFNYSRSLVHLDISECWFELESIPEAFADMASLSYLSLYSNLIRGSIPESFGNLTSLTYLDLCQNRFEGFVPKSFGNLASLERLDLHSNRLQGEIPRSIWEICTLKYLNAYDNNLSGSLKFAASSSRCDNFSLEYLDLTQNQITGPLSDFTLYPSLKEIHLSSNRLSGDVSESIGQLSKLEILDLSKNSIEAAMSKAHFAKLFGLSHLDLSSNKRIVLDIPSDWIPPFQLEYINLGSCEMGPDFPKWLETQKNYTELNVSRSGISDSIPSWLWNLPAELRSLDLSNNELRGNIPDHNQNFTYQMVQIDLSSNQLEGSVPLFLLEIYALNLFQNRFSDLSSICNVSTPASLGFLDVSYNLLTGELPSCWSKMRYLRILILGNNKLTGRVPISIGYMDSIETLHLADNEFTGELPQSLENCTELMVFDVGGNKLTGEIPAWIGESGEKLVILSLRSNNFYGSLPRKLCQLGNLQVLDLSSNNLSSTILTCLSNITAMRQVESIVSNIQHLYDFRAFPGFLLSYNGKLTTQWKGSLSELQNLGLLKNMDLSSNKFTGEIPREFTELIGLVSLNLSRNNLRGQIPLEIGRMRYLDALDLSKNHLSGKIPSSLSQIDCLGVLDLSSNNLSGKIPTGTQLQNREAAAYMENPELCGAPLPRKCPGEEEEEEPTVSKTAKDSHEDGDKDEIITKGFYISVAIGFIVGFWGICGTLAFNKSWRYGYFKLLNKVGDRVYATVAAHNTKLLSSSTV